MARMRFGIFMAPFHAPTGQNPTAAYARDLSTIQLLDELGYDEAWIGEHHSGGVELIPSPEIFIAHVAAQTRHIKLGAGVISLPYHNPLWVADRMILLDHLTRGRAMMGVGPGALPTDAAMIGIDPLEQRAALEEDFDVLMHLLTSDEPISVETKRYRLVDARSQYRPYTDPCFDIGVAAIASPSGPRLAGRYGVGLLSVGATISEGFDVLNLHCDVMEERAAQFGTTADRNKWRNSCEVSWPLAISSRGARSGRWRLSTDSPASLLDSSHCCCTGERSSSWPPRAAARISRCGSRLARP
jgi:limonene 1,2-monooxygenase